jgi:AGCS family alanine or glycine:cation symporter
MLGEMIRLLGDSTAKINGHEKHISSFQAFAISLASRVGTGNLAGVATALTVGGPGAIFWMWIIALLGSSSAFVESTLAQLFKVKGKHSYVGGPAYYMERGLKKRWMGVLFAVLITVTFGLAFNSVQSNTMSAALQSAFSVEPLNSGIVISVLTLVIIFGGVHRIAAISSVIVPVMAVGYIALALFVVLANIDRIPAVVEQIVGNAFGWHQAVGGGIGTALMQGIKRGLFSNEAGMGSAPNAAATAHVTHPAKQGFIQALGVFTDTLLICSCTAFIILFDEDYIGSGLDGIQLTQAALTSEVGNIGGIYVAIATLFFAYSSILGNYYYGEANIRFFTSRQWPVVLYRMLVGGMVLFGSLASLNLAYRKQRKHTHKQTRKMIMRLLALLGKILGEIRRQMRVHPDEELLNYKQLDMLETVTRVYRQQKNHFKSGDSRESIPNRIVSLSKPYIRPIVRGKETKIVEFGAKCNNILIDGISFIEKLSFNAFNEGTRLKHCVSLSKKLTGVDVKKIGGDQGYSGNDNRTFCKENGIETSFTQKGRTGKNEVKNATKRELARVRATAMEGSFGTQKEHYGLRKIAARIKSTEIMLIFFGIHTANVVNLARRESVQVALAA